MSLDKKEAAEKQTPSYTVDQRLLHVETSTDALNNLTQAAMKAKEKFYPRYWYCSDLVVRYAKEARATLQGADFSKNYETAMKNLDRLNRGLDQMLRFSSAKLPEALTSDLGLDPATKSRLKTMESKHLVPTLLRAGVPSERLAWISLFVMMKESSGKTDAAAEEATFPLERSLKDYVKKIEISSLLADLDKFSNAL